MAKTADALESSHAPAITPSTEVARTLLGVNPSEYGDHYRAHVLEQYKKYLEMADKISDRRTAANTFFLTVNTGLISAFGLANAFAGQIPKFLFIAASLAAMLLCYSWYRLIRSYRDLNSAKFKVVHEIEKLLPLKPFDAEWEAAGRGRNRKLYWPFTHIERFVPWIFILLYLGITAAALYRLASVN